MHARWRGVGGAPVDQSEAVAQVPPAGFLQESEQEGDTAGAAANAPTFTAHRVEIIMVAPAMAQVLEPLIGYPFHALPCSDRQAAFQIV
jgi:hypothetical protein